MRSRTTETGWAASRSTPSTSRTARRAATSSPRWFPPDPVTKGDMEGEPDWTMVEGFHNPRVALLALDLLPNVKFGENSWRGDLYAPELYHAILEDIAYV